MVSPAAMQETQSPIPGSGRSPGEGKGDPLQCSCPEAPMDRGAWQVTAHWVTKSWTRHTPDSDSGSEEQDDDFHRNKLVKVIESWLLVLFIELFFFPELRICLSKEGVGGPHSSSLFLKYLFICLCQVLVEASLVAQLVKNPPAMQVTPVQFLGWEDPLEKGKATHSSILGLPLWLSW